MEKRKLNSLDWGKDLSLQSLLELGIGPACYHLIYQGATIQGTEDCPHSAPRVRVDHTLKPEVFRGASLRNRVCVCYGPLEKK